MIARCWWFLLFGLSAAAQTSMVNGALDGSVSDSNGGRISAVTLTVRDKATGQSRQVSTNAEGAFHLAELPPSDYEVTLSQAGFAPYRHAGVTLPLGSTVHLEIVLRPGDVTTQVTVTAQPSPLDSTETSLSSSVDTERIEELPVVSRNYLNFVLLAPGVAASAQQPGRASLAPLPDSGFTFGGLRGRSNNISIDGVDNNDEYAGSSRTELSLETVQEFQVVNAGLSAETGGASGGAINVLTRTGGNQLHGDAFLFLQDGSLDAPSPFETERAQPDVHRSRAGAALGGPLVKDRTFYYAAFEQEHLRALDDSFIDPHAAAALSRYLNPGRFPVARAETEASAKVDHQLTRRNHLMLRYAFTNNRESGDAFNTSGWTDASARGSAFTADHAVVGSLSTVFNSQTIGDLRFQIADRHAVTRTNDAAGPGIEIAGLVNFGRPYDGNGRRSERHDQAGYSVTHSAGRHIWKAGLTANHVHLEAAIADGFAASYTFATLTDFLASRPDSFRQTLGSVPTDFAVTTYGAFLQDHWSLSKKLTLDLGLRYDFEHLPAPFRQDPNNVSPRAGLAYQPARAWVLRAGYGIFFDRYLLSALNRALQKNGVQAFEEVLTGDTAAAAFRNAPIAAAAPSIYRVDSNLATPYSQQTSFGVEHQFASDLTASVSYLLVRGVKLSRTRNINLLPPGPDFTAARADPRFNDIYQLEDSASSHYQGVTFALNRRLADELEFSASYTISKTFDNASDFDEQPQNPFELAAEWALSRQHQQQRVVANLLWELPIGDQENGAPPKRDLFTRVFGHFQVGPIFTAESGRPANPLIGTDANRSHAFPFSARPAGFGRNSLRSPALVNVDFRLVKFFPLRERRRLDLVTEAFNLLNHSNVTQVNNVFGAGFGQPIAGAAARQIQFSLDFEF
jgi:hypothetical protein